MATAPTVTWSYISDSSGVLFDPDNGNGTLGGPPSVSVGAGAWVEFGVFVEGTWSAALAGDFTAGALSIVSVTGTLTDVGVGQRLADANSPPIFWSDLDYRITGISGSTIDFTDLVGGVPAPSPIGSLVTGSGLAFTVSEPIAFGTVTATASPSYGVAFVDSNPTGSGNGTGMANMRGQAAVGFVVTFSVSGSFTVGATFTPSDSVYAAASATGISVTVS